MDARRAVTPAVRADRRGRAPWRDVAPLVVWSAALVGAIVAFHALGRGALAAPSLLEPAGWFKWARTRDAVTIGFVLLRLLVLSLAWYLVGVTTVGAAARVARVVRLVRIADALTVPSVRRLLQSALGLGLATAVVGSATAAVAPSPHPVPGDRGEVVAVLATDLDGPRAPGEGVAPPGMEVPAAPRTGPPRHRDADVDVGARDDAEVEVRVGDEVAMEREPAASPAAWVVRPGDHFWSIADRVLDDAWGRAPTADEIVGYWRRLVERNRAELVDPSDPDLIHPGQVLELPEPPVRPDDG